MFRALNGRNWALLLAPQELAGRPEGVIFAAVCVVAVGLITAADFLAPRYGTVGAADLIPVAAAAWLLSRRLTTGVVVIAMAATVLEAVAGATHPLTAASRIVMVPLLAVLAQLAATNVIGRYELERRARAARELDRAKSDFLRLASHELRGPVSILRGYLSMLEDGSLGDTPAPVRKVAPILSATAAAMNRIVDQMLDVSRLEDSRLQLNRAPTDLVKLVEQAASTVEALHGRSHQIEVRGVVVPLLNVDPGRVSTIVGNLVSNAIKYSPAGSHVRVAIQTDAGEVTIAVADEGIGIADSDKAILFSRFGRVTRPDTRNVTGTGLGLYLSRELARLHGGEISFESKLGEGSTFTLHLPLRPQPPQAENHTPAPAATPARREALG